MNNSVPPNLSSHSSSYKGLDAAKISQSMLVLQADPCFLAACAFDPSIRPMAETWAPTLLGPCTL